VYVTAYVGTGLSTPSWALIAQPGIDPVGYNTSGVTPSRAPFLVTDGSTVLYGIYGANANFFSGNQLRLITCNSISALSTPASWTGELVYDYETGTDVWSLLFQSVSAAIERPLLYLIPAAPVAIEITLRGVKRVRKPAEERFCPAPQDTPVKRAV
jgi:hypothetical protein